MELYLFAPMLEDPTIRAMVDFKTNPNKQAYFQAFPALLKFSATDSITSDPVREYILGKILGSIVHGSYLSSEVVGDYLKQDTQVLFEFAFLTNWDELCAAAEVLPFPKNSTARTGKAACETQRYAFCGAKSAEELMCLIQSFFEEYSDISEAKYSAFRWQNHALVGVSTLDTIDFDSLSGLSFQKEKLISNTQNFLENKPANNVLLVGSSGTGKSSSVKATLNLFKERGLNMVELTKKDLKDLAALMEVLRLKQQHYIIFIDDLSFEDADESYIGLKVALDGQLEPKPAHVLIYATSNRRRLMKESWSEREGADDIHSHDTLHEKMSLSERFGIRLYFGVLSQKEYFHIIENMLTAHGIAFTPELGVAAATWATTNNGRSGRSASQFVNHYLAQNHLA